MSRADSVLNEKTLSKAELASFKKAVGDAFSIAQKAGSDDDSAPFWVAMLDTMTAVVDSMDSGGTKPIKNADKLRV